MTTVRLDDAQERSLESLAARRGISKSELIKLALDELFARDTEERSSYEIGKDRFGMHGNAERGKTGAKDA